MNKNSGVLAGIRQRIMQGDWKPGDRLKPAQLAEEFGTSTTVVREALTRLAGEGALRSATNRGFFVPELSADEVRDITRVRCNVEGLALELALERGDIHWESALIAAHHEMARTPRRLPGTPSALNEDWSEAHRRFHVSLLSGCGVPSLLDFSEKLHTASELYRRWAAPSQATTGRNVEKEHADILAAALARDVELSTALLTQHYQLTMEIVLAEAPAAAQSV